MRTRIALALTVALLGALVGGPAGAEIVVPGCAEVGPNDGGEWRSYGHDLNNTRSQPDENQITPGNVANLGMVGAFDPSTVDGVLNGGGFSNTPIVADGCLYLATNTGWVFSLNADDLTQVNWKVKFTGAGQTLLGGIIVGSPVVYNGVVFVGVSDPGIPYVAAIDQVTGEKLWTSVVTGWDDETGRGYHPDTEQRNALINASPVAHDGMVFQGFSGNEGTSVARGGLAFVDSSPACGGSTSGIECFNQQDGATGGTILKHTYTINDTEYEAGYRGASIWCTAAWDTEAKSVYACGGNPASKRLEARHSNALLKIDADRLSATFGEITHAYKGDVDQYFPGLDRQPACDMFGEDIVYVAWSLPCFQLDVDFGASPNLWYDETLDEMVVGALQKSGVYHTAFGDNMQRAWTQIVGLPCFACNAASTAIGDDQVYMATTPVGQVVAITQDQGRYRWAHPLGDQIHFHATSHANGIVYTMDAGGHLNAIDAATGLPLMKRNLAMDVGGPVSDTGSIGIAIARNTVYAAYSNWIVAYK